MQFPANGDYYKNVTFTNSYVDAIIFLAFAKKKKINYIYVSPEDEIGKKENIC